MHNLKRIQEAHRKFTNERNWDKFQTPKNLCMALSVEVAELVEIFMWLSEKQASSLKDEQLKAVSEEMADIFIYLLRLADITNNAKNIYSDSRGISSMWTQTMENAKALVNALPGWYLP